MSDGADDHPPFAETDYVNGAPDAKPNETFDPLSPGAWAPPPGRYMPNLEANKNGPPDAAAPPQPKPEIALLDGPAIAEPLPDVDYLVREIGLVAGGARRISSQATGSAVRPSLRRPSRCALPRVARYGASTRSVRVASSTLTSSRASDSPDAGISASRSRPASTCTSWATRSSSPSCHPFRSSWSTPTGGARS